MPVTAIWQDGGSRSYYLSVKWHITLSAQEASLRKGKTSSLNCSQRRTFFINWARILLIKADLLYFLLKNSKDTPCNSTGNLIVD